MLTEAWNKAKTSENSSFHAWKYSWRTQRRCAGIFFGWEGDGGGGEATSVFSQLAKRSARVLRESYRRICVLIMRITSKTIDQRFWEGTKNIAVQGGTVSHDNISVICKFIDFMSLFRHSVWFSFSVKQFPSAEFGICNMQLRMAHKNHRRVEL